MANLLRYSWFHDFQQDFCWPSFSGDISLMTPSMNSCVSQGFCLGSILRITPYSCIVPSLADVAETDHVLFDRG